MNLEPGSTLRASFLDGRQATLLVGRQKLIVRVFDEPPHGFRIATIQACSLAVGAETVLRIDGAEIPVLVVRQRAEKRYTVVGLRILDEAYAPAEPIESV